jgi:hypothetical protein
VTGDGHRGKRYTAAQTWEDGLTGSLQQGEDRGVKRDMKLQATRLGWIQVLSENDKRLHLKERPTCWEKRTR